MPMNKHITLERELLVTILVSVADHGIIAGNLVHILYPLTLQQAVQQVLVVSLEG